MTTKSQARKIIEKNRAHSLTFGEMISSLRKADELSQIQLAKRLKVSKAHLCDIEKGRRHPSVQKAVEFAKAMGYSPLQFAARVLEDQANAAGLSVKVLIEVA